VSDYWSQYAYEHLRPHSTGKSDRGASTGSGLTCNPFNLDKYCGDMFDAQMPDLPLITSLDSLDSIDLAINAAASVIASTMATATSGNVTTVGHNSCDSAHEQSSTSSRSGLSCGSRRSSGRCSHLPPVSLLPLNFGQPFIQSEFPARLRFQSVLLHSVQCSAGRLVGLVSVWNHTFEKRVVIRYSTDKWATERQAEARYLQPDRLSSADQFHFELRVQSHDFASFAATADSDRTLVFAVRYETSDHRVFWDNNYGQDYRIRCRL
jgi:hypothetical protein